ncbi:MAG TPA: hypothetical protein VFI61_00065 [Patescibacteria group bacterium]|nr:hypothetical protein [Patescibacteria group bacterium]
MKQLAEIDFGSFKGLGTGPLANPGTSGIEIFSKFVSSAIGLMTIIAIVWFVFTFFMGAFGIISAGGDKQAMEGARKKISSGIIGLVVVIAAIFIIKLIGFLLGIPNILNITQLFGQITQ